MGTEDGSWNEQDTDAISVGEMGQRIQTAITQVHLDYYCSILLTD